MLSLVNVVEAVRGILHLPQTLFESRFKPSYFTRNRKLTFPMLLQLLLQNRKCSTQCKLDDFFSQTGGGEHMSQQAFSKARNHFDHTPFQKIFYATRDGDYADASALGRFLGYLIVAIDGSTVPLPAIPELRVEFGAVGAGATSPAARASIAYDVMNDRIMEADLTPLSQDERTLASAHIQSLSTVIDMGGALFIFDRGYASEGLIRQIHGAGARYLFRLRSKFNLAADAAPLGDSRISTNPAASAQASLQAISASMAGYARGFESINGTASSEVEINTAIKAPKDTTRLA